MIKKVNFDDVDGQELARAEELVEQLERDIIKKCSKNQIKLKSLKYNLSSSFHSKMKSGDSLTESAAQGELSRESPTEGFEVIIDPPVEPRRPVEANPNWQDGYTKKPRRDRVRWESKLFQYGKKFSTKSLAEQAEELMDVAAQEFTNWINGLSSDEKSNLNKEMIKELFSIGISRHTSTALECKPKQRPAVSHEMAVSFGLPEMAIEKNVKRILAQDRAQRRKPSNNIAFGRTLPQYLRRPSEPYDEQSLKPLLPDDIRSGKVLFEGICHLRSTKALLDFLDENPQLEKPKYLIESQELQERKTQRATKNFQNSMKTSIKRTNH